MLCAQTLQSCPTLCNPMDCTLPSSSVDLILQQEYWSELPCPPPGVEPVSLPSPALQADSLPLSLSKKVKKKKSHFTREASLKKKKNARPYAVHFIQIIDSPPPACNVDNCCARCPNPQAGREGLQDNATGKKGKFITDSSQGPLPHPTQWCRSESPQPKLLHKFIG